MRRVAALFLAASVAGPASAQGQVQIDAAALVETFEFADPGALTIDQVQLVSTPVAAAFSPLDFLTLSFTAGYADGIVTFDGGGSISKSGPLDTALGLELRGGGFVLRGRADLPTGDAEYSVEEALLIGVLASEALPFSSSAWGRGGSFSVDGGLDRHLGRVGMMVTAGLVTARERPAIADFDALYRPGDAVRFRAAFDARVGVSSAWSLLLGLQVYDADAYQGANLFRPGKRLEALATYAFPFGASESALVYGGFYARMGSAIVAPLESPRLLGLVASPSRRTLHVGAQARLDRGRYAIIPEASVRSYYDGEGDGAGWLVSAGGSIDYRIAGGRYGRRVVIAPEARLTTGSVTGPVGARSGVAGWRAGVTLRLLASQR